MAIAQKISRSDFRLLYLIPADSQLRTTTPAQISRNVCLVDYHPNKDTINNQRGRFLIRSKNVPFDFLNSQNIIFLQVSP